MRPGGGWQGKGDTMDVSDADILHAEHQMLTRMGYRPDEHDPLAWVDKVLDKPLLLRGGVEERRLTHDSTKSCAVANVGGTLHMTVGDGCSRTHHCTQCLDG